MSQINIPIEFTSDEKGFFDRQCPNDKCEFVFKVYMADWEDKVSDEEVFCPMCGHSAPSDQWFTSEQLDAIEEIAASYAMSYVSKELDKIFGNMARSMRGSKYLKVTYKPGKKISFINNPIGQQTEWELEITCEKCQTKYSVIGSAYFCPCCGCNAVERVFLESLDTVEKMIGSIEDIHITLEKNFGKDKAETMCRSMIEGTLGNIISAFQKYAAEIYRSISPDKKVRVNDFQIVEKGSLLFKEAIGKGYEEWLSQEDMTDLNMLFQQRHIIEHNNGIIDERYIHNSGDTSYKVGQRVIVRNQDTLRLLNHIRKITDGLKSMVTKIDRNIDPS